MRLADDLESANRERLAARHNLRSDAFNVAMKKIGSILEEVQGIVMARGLVNEFEALYHEPGDVLPRIADFLRRNW